MDQEILVRDQILSHYDSLYEAEKKVADYLLHAPEKVIDMSVSEVAVQCEASQATIIRCCKKIGYKGFQQLKIKMAGEQHHRKDTVVTNEIHPDQMEQSIENILNSKIEELRATFHSIDIDEWKELIEKLKNASVIEFAAMGNTIPVALDAAYKFSKLGLRAITSTIAETQKNLVQTLGEKDVLVIISASGRSTRLHEMQEIAKKNGVTTVIITNQPKADLALSCDYKILTVSREHVFYNENNFSRMTALAVIDSLFLFLFSVIDQPEKPKKGYFS